MSNDIAYLQETSRHRQTMPLYEAVPQTENAWVAPNASLIGDVFLSKWSTVWYNCTIRGEMNAVRIGHFSSIGDATTIDTNHALPHGISSSVNIGKNVQIEARCNIHSCIIDDDCVIGAGSTIMQGARLERGCVILPNSVVGPGALIPAGQVWGGNKVKFVRNLSSEEQLQNYTESYSKGANTSASKFSLWPNDF
jgi:carbonic anhydrase/acetyltransferase-like protein (isoleucine patch superfamily)